MNLLDIEGVIALGGITRARSNRFRRDGFDARPKSVGMQQDCGGDKDDATLIGKLRAPPSLPRKAFPAAVRNENCVRRARPFRVDRRDQDFTAAMAGANIPPLKPCKIPATNTSANVGRSARINADNATISTPTAMSPRFHLTVSARAPPGSCAATPASPPTISTRPTSCFDQFRLAK